MDARSDSLTTALELSKALVYSNLDEARELRGFLSDQINEAAGMKHGHTCAGCGSVYMDLDQLIGTWDEADSLLDIAQCTATYTGLEGEVLECNVLHGEKQEHGHWMDRIIKWTDVDDKEDQEK